LRHVYVLSLAACLGCSSPPAGDDFAFDPCAVIVLSVDPGATEAEVASVIEGAAMWNRTGATRFTLEAIPDAPRLSIHFQDAAAAFHGLYDGDARALFVNKALDDAHERAVTVAHELGHAVGLPHIASRVSVMLPANLEVEPNPDDALELARVWGGCPSP
jgi:hypothetical protein